MEEDQVLAGWTASVALKLMLVFYLTAVLLLHFQLIFKRYAKDKTSSISSFEMRNAVNDAGEQQRI